MTIYLCRLCGKPHNKKPNACYCNECNKIVKEKMAHRYRITDTIWVWVRRGSIVRVVVSGKNIEPELEGKEVIE